MPPLGSPKKRKKSTSKLPCLNTNDKRADKKPRFSTEALEALSCVPSVLHEGGKVETKYSSLRERDVLLGCFGRDVVQKYLIKEKKQRLFNRESTTRRATKGGKGSTVIEENERKAKSEDENSELKTMNLLAREVWARVCIGTNECTRVIERSMSKNAEESQKVEVIIMARDVRPARMLAHIPVMAELQNVPIVLMSGRASLALGSLLGIRCCSIMTILSRRPCTVEKHDLSESEVQAIETCHENLGTFIEFAKRLYAPI